MKTLLKTPQIKLTVLLVTLTLVSLLLAACGQARNLPAPIEGNAPVQGAPSLDGERMAYPVPDPWTVREGQVPAEYIEAVKADLAVLRNIDSNEIQIIRSEAVTYNNGALGCPDPDMMYTEALVDGYQVVLYFDEIEFDYRISDTGAFVLCVMPQP